MVTPASPVGKAQLGQRVGDAYHSALCSLDSAEMYLELNLCDEAAERAERARRPPG